MEPSLSKRPTLESIADRITCYDSVPLPPLEDSWKIVTGCKQIRNMCTQMLSRVRYNVYILILSAACTSSKYP
ncbi:hypothetical protein VNO77_18100 [Canavalia gladiata]|uniref:Uncharacterized protein n=1 Tax=Canavalia gladiata TaxID=3824 RepID=A0AAN9QK01_CANGL